MANIRVDLENLRRNYKGECRAAFEDMVTHMFMRRLTLSNPPVRRKNQKGVESDPVDVINDIDEDCRAGRYAYQAKYLDQSTRISSIKDQLLESIETAKERKVTDLFFFVNKQLTENPNAQSGGEPDANFPVYQKAIVEAAGNAAVKIHWYPRDVIELELCKPEYGYIRRMFLDDGNTFDTFGYYEHICDKMCKIDDNYKEVYGDISLLESYIEPLIRDRNGKGQNFPCKDVYGIEKTALIGHNQSVREYLEYWVTGKNSVTIICGEPGHGKTSLGWKAAYDFYKNGWLENKVENVFCFSLNPVGLGEAEKKGIFDNKDIRPLLSWESDDEERQKETQKAAKADCKKSLIFLDGFDELKESVPGHTMGELLDAVWKYLNRYNESCNRPHIVITTRRMAIPPDSERKEYECPDDNEYVVPIKELQPVEGKRQYEWISNYCNHLETRKEKKSAFPENYIEKYKKMYSSLNPKDELKEVLGVPIIFRMIVAQGYIPDSGSHPAAIYDDLFKKTLQRHNVKTGGLVVRKLSRHALRVYADNGESAEVHDDLDIKKSPWIYAFYTRYRNGDGENSPSQNKLRVGFLHKTFYEYFLAAGILSWLKSCREDGKMFIDRRETASIADLFSVFGKQRLSEEVLLSVRTLYQKEQGKKEKIYDEAFEAIYRFLRETDGILNIPKYEMIEPIEEEPVDRRDIRDLFYDIRQRMNERELTPFRRGENVFWNALSICSVCGHPIILNSSYMDESKYSVNGRVLRSYNLFGVHLEGADLKSANLRGALLAECHLEKANLKSADLRSAHLERSFFRGADLYGANLEEADLRGANLPGVRLEGAILRNAVLDGAFLKEASIKGAVLEGAILNRAVLSGARLEGVYLDGVVYDETEKVCKGASVGAFEMHRTDFKRAIMDGAFLSSEQARSIIRAGGLGLPDEAPKVIRITESKRLIQVVRGGKSRIIDLSKFGHYTRNEDGNEVPLSWRVLRMEGDKALIITEKPIKGRNYHDSREDITWEDCSLRKWLNGEFLRDSFTERERGMIALVCIQNPDNELSGTKGGNPTWDRVFVLNIDEAKLYFRSDKDRRIGGTGWWWLRSPGDYSNYAAVVDFDGYVYMYGNVVDDPSVSIRPALWLNL